MLRIKTKTNQSIKYEIMHLNIKEKTYTIILLIGMWISFTKKPINPIIANPIAVAIAIFWNSEKKEKKI